MKENYIKVLMIEDSRPYAQLVLELIEEARGIEISLDHSFRVSTGLEYLKKEVYDVILLDLTLPDSSGIDTLKKVQAEAENVPIVVMTSLDDEDLTSKALQSGAQDYLIKGEFDSNLLVRALKYAIERKQAGDALRESEQILSAIFQEIPSLIAITTLSEGLYVDVNKAFETTTGYSREEAIARTIYDLDFFEKKDQYMTLVSRVKEQGVVQDMEIKFRKRSGEDAIGLISARQINIKGKKCLLSVVTDITARKRDEEKIRSLLELQTSRKND